MVPILLCSIVAAAISVERLWTLQRSRITPKNLLAQVWGAIKSDDVDSQRLRELRIASPLGQVFAAGISNAKRGRDIMKEAMEALEGKVGEAVEQISRLKAEIGDLKVAREAEKKRFEVMQRTISGFSVKIDGILKKLQTFE